MAISTFRRSEAFEARSEQEDGLTRVLLYGELDIAGIPLLEQECRRIEGRGSRIAALDLSGLTFMDVAGLGALISAQARAQNDGRALPLFGAGAPVRRVFDLTGNSGLLDVDPSPAPVTLNGYGRA